MSILKTHLSAKKQHGAAIVEFAIIAMLLFTLLLAIMEFGRVFYLWNTVQEVTRRAARVAVVTDANLSSQVSNLAVFQPSSSAGGVPGAANIVTSASVKIDYLEKDGVTSIPSNKLPSTPSDNIDNCINGSSNCIGFVKAQICITSRKNCNPVSYLPMVGLFGFLNVMIPVSAVVMPAESMGLS